MIKNHILYADFCDWKFTITKAEGSYLWNEKNEKLLDFTSGWNVANLGWNHPEIYHAIIDQTKKNSYVPMWTNDEAQEMYAKALTSVLPKELDTVVRATGGTDANEKALLLARFITKRKKIIGFTDTYHGHSYGTISIGYRPEYITGEAPVVPEFIKMDYPVAIGEEKIDQATLQKFINNLEELLKHEDVAAIVTEAGIITGWGSTYVAPSGFLKAVRKITEKYGTLLILDEVGTGFSRCGKLFGMELEGVIPDMATFAKAIANGTETIAAVATKSTYGEVLLSQAKTHSTLAWMSLGCAAALKTLEIHLRDKVWEQAEVNGKYLLNLLNTELRAIPEIGYVTGKGMEIGLQFADPQTKKPNDTFAKRIISQAYQKGLHLVFGGDGNIQIMPPLMTSKDDLIRGIDILVDTVKKEIKK